MTKPPRITTQSVIFDLPTPQLEALACFLDGSDDGPVPEPGLSYQESYLKRFDQLRRMIVDDLYFRAEFAEMEYCGCELCQYAIERAKLFGVPSRVLCIRCGNYPMSSADNSNGFCPMCFLQMERDRLKDS